MHSKQPRTIRVQLQSRTILKKKKKWIKTFCSFVLFLISWCYCSAPVFLLSLHTPMPTMWFSTENEKIIWNWKISRRRRRRLLSCWLWAYRISCARSLCIRVGPCCVLGFSHSAQLSDDELLLLFSLKWKHEFYRIRCESSIRNADNTFIVVTTETLHPRIKQTLTI